MKKHGLVHDDGPNVRFVGELLAEVSSRTANNNTRWTEIDLYRTEAGKLIAHEVHRTQWQGESDSRTVHICDNESDLIDALGHDLLAKELYREASIEDAVHVA